MTRHSLSIPVLSRPPLSRPFLSKQLPDKPFLPRVINLSRPGRRRSPAFLALLAMSAMLFHTAAQAAPPGADPVYCSAIVAIEAKTVFTCRRSDGSGNFTTVPEGQFLHITDIIVNPNNIATSGTFTASIGRDDGDDFPGRPELDLIGSPSQQLHFSTPYIVLREGQSLAVNNFAESNFSIDVRVSGYLSDKASP